MFEALSVARFRLVATLLVVLSGACTGDGATSSSPTESAAGSGATTSSIVFELGGRTYRSECLPVPEALLDIKLANVGSATGLVRAITGIPAIQGVAVPGRGTGCGTYSFAIVDGLSDGTARALRAEIRTEDDRFD
jgi:hypothetical protein